MLNRPHYFSTESNPLKIRVVAIQYTPNVLLISSLPRLGIHIEILKYQCSTYSALLLLRYYHPKIQRRLRIIIQPLCGVAEFQSGKTQRATFAVRNPKNSPQRSHIAVFGFNDWTYFKANWLCKKRNASRTDYSGL